MAGRSVPLHCTGAPLHDYPAGRADHLASQELRLAQLGELQGLLVLRSVRRSLRYLGAHPVRPGLREVPEAADNSLRAAIQQADDHPGHIQYCGRSVCVISLVVYESAELGARLWHHIDRALLHLLGHASNGVRLHHARLVQQEARLSDLSCRPMHLLPAVLLRVPLRGN